MIHAGDCFRYLQPAHPLHGTGDTLAAPPSRTSTAESAMDTLLFNCFASRMKASPGAGNRLHSPHERRTPVKPRFRRARAPAPMAPRVWHCADGRLRRRSLAGGARTGTSPEEPITGCSHHRSDWGGVRATTAGGAARQAFSGCMQWPPGFRAGWPAPTHSKPPPGTAIYDRPWGGHVVRVIVLNQITEHPRYSGPGKSDNHLSYPDAH